MLFIQDFLKIFIMFFVFIFFLSEILKAVYEFHIC